MLTVNAILFIALRGVARDNNVPNGDPGDSFSDALNDSGSLMTKDAGEFSFGIMAIESVDISVAEGIGDDFNSDFPFFGRINKDFFNNK